MPAAVLHALPRRPPPDPRQLQRCLLLAVLLHVWLVLMFGNATGSAAPGQGVWGSLTVKLLGRSGGEPGAPPGAPPAEPAPDWRDNGAPGQNPQQRQGGQVRATEPAPSTQLGAAELGRWNPSEVPPEAARTEEASPAPVVPPAPSTATLNLPKGFRPIEREDLGRPAPAAPLQPPAPELPAAVGRLETRPEATVAPLPAAANLRPPSRTTELPPLPADLPAAVSRLEAAPPLTSTALPRPAELRAVPAPAAAAQATTAELPPPVRRLEAPTETGALAPMTRAAELRPAPGATAPPVTPSAALPPVVQRLEAPSADGTSGVAPLTRASELRAPTATAASPTAVPNAQDLPTAVRRLESADSAGSVTPLQATPSPRAALAAPGAPSGSSLRELSNALPGQVSAPAGMAKGDPTIDLYGTPKASAGSPNAGSRLGPDLAVPPSAAASAPRAPLNLALPRSGDMAARRSPGLIGALPQPPERKSKLEQSIEETANADCRKAYAGAGLLAVIPLALDTARGKGCKW